MLRSRLIYLALLIAAFIFSQALYDSISLFTLAVVLLIPLISLLCLLVSLPLVKVDVEPAPARVSRMRGALMKATIRSKTPLMLPMMKFFFTVSNPEGDASVPGYSVVHYRAFGTTTVEIPLLFNVRGLYKVGVDYVELYDFLRLFRIKRRINKESYLTAAPRNLKVTLPVQAISREQENTLTSGGRETQNGGDLSGIREFNEYDTLRRVHWKLSARLSKMIVKTYWENACDNIMVLADLFPYEEERLLNRRLTDCVAEIVLEIGALLAEQGVRTSLAYPSYDSMLQTHSISSAEEQMAAADAFSMAPMMEGGSLEQILHEVDFNSLQGGALYVVSSMPPEELDKALRPYVRGLNCELQYLVVRPGAEAPYGRHMKVITLNELEQGGGRR